MIDPSITEILREKDLLKASAIFEIPVDLLRRMNEQGLLNVDNIKYTVIRQDFLNYKRYIKAHHSQRYDEGEILIALQKEYRMNLQNIRDIVYKNYNKTGIFCKCCGKRISNLTARRTDGLCPTCNAETLPKY